jgi:Amt family ammonium transporter
MSYDLASRRIIFQDGVLDFAGGTVVHMSAGYGISGAMFLGKRKTQIKSCTYYLCIARNRSIVVWLVWFQLVLH